MTVGLPNTCPVLAVFRLNPLVQLHWRDFDGDWVLFEALSGQTHQLDAVTAAVLMCFESGASLSRPDLLATLAIDFGITMPATEAAPIWAVLDQLAALGLVIPHTPNAAV